jgi:hypothetical protein
MIAVFPESHNMLGRSARNALAGALFVIGTIAMYRWVVSPHVAYLRAVQRLGPAVERMAAEDDRIRRSLGPGLRRLQSMQQERTDLQEGLFTRAEFTSFIRNLPALVEQTGCTVIVADFTGGSDPGATRGADPDAAFTARPAGLSVRGTLDQLTALLDRLQKNRPRVWVDTFRMERVGGAGTEPFKCQLALVMYTLAEPAPARPGENEGPVL